MHQLPHISSNFLPQIRFRIVPWNVLVCDEVCWSKEKNKRSEEVNLTVCFGLWWYNTVHNVTTDNGSLGPRWLWDRSWGKKKRKENSCEGREEEIKILFGVLWKRNKKTINGADKNLERENNGDSRINFLKKMRKNYLEIDNFLLFK